MQLLSDILNQGTWSVLEIRDRWGNFIYVDREGEYQEKERSEFLSSEIFYLYFDGKFVLGFTESGVAFSSLSDMSGGKIYA